MGENETITSWEDRAAGSERDVANMDEYDFMNLLIESRIIEGP